eukprot:CAMPEP_0182570458 /NCGR_PEP_ID=MMETSP1324-20130603/10766_1 /TAXON_ID=236786 /ORGANISM="Florenciella sp., Strain RCC1587" /LENGTH=365 /DNA_ID=CAMNT_0024784857 /DNA_START=53 /DNA_END=1150 /DNA_ORIENTATION=-
MSRDISAANAAMAGALAIGAYYMLAKPTPPRRNLEAHADDADADSTATPNTQRKAVIATGIARDHDGSVVVKADPDFDLNLTIFGTVDGLLPRMVVKSKLAVQLFWRCEKVQQVQALYSTLSPPPKHDVGLLQFMNDECDFKMEHADGSFMDHLNFCHEYSHRHFQGHSPRVLFLHSIMGVGTNIFPMGTDKIPKLKGMLTEAEYTHVEAFPSILRLLIGSGLLDELKENRTRLRSLKRLSFHRVIDNMDLTMSAEQFWVHLNYHICHLLDFLPTSCWAYHINQDALFMVFVDLYTFMKEESLIQAEVNLDLTSSTTSTEGTPVTLGSCIARALPNFVKLKLQSKAINKFSAKIGHSLDYTLHFE